MFPFEEIEQAVVRASWAADERDVELLADSYTEDASFHIAIGGQDVLTVEGRGKLVGTLRHRWEREPSQLRHYHSNFRMEEVADDSAVVVSVGLVVKIEDGEASIMTTGWYRDQLQQANGEWRVHDRYLRLDKPFF